MEEAGCSKQERGDIQCESEVTNILAAFVGFARAAALIALPSK